MASQENDKMAEQSHVDVQGTASGMEAQTTVANDLEVPVNPLPMIERNEEPDRSISSHGKSNKYMHVKFFNVCFVFNRSNACCCLR